ncbi:zinc-binding dehydrogenase [Gammaproteobacteria bacterium]|nr:zinc-binding dehydrogenase [Gammaproteobacteria bacterium]
MKAVVNERYGSPDALAIWSSLTASGRVVFPTPRSSQSFVEFLRARIEAGEFHPVIDRKYPLCDIADAYRYVESEQKAGIVVIEVVPEDVLPENVAHSC